MIPIGDASRRPVRLPLVTIAIIVVNALVFLLELAPDAPRVLADAGSALRSSTHRCSRGHYIALVREPPATGAERDRDDLPLSGPPAMPR